ncbi:hypothetical protein BH23VER1_BH23VER1_36110 [soil metagenome]
MPTQRNPAAALLRAATIIVPSINEIFPFTHCETASPATLSVIDSSPIPVFATIIAFMRE